LGFTARIKDEGALPIIPSRWDATVLYPIWAELSVK
jgi:hypothetical protein